MINSRGRARLEDPPFPPTKCPLDPSPDARTESVITATAPGHGRVFVAALEADQMGRHDRILFRARLPRGGAGFDLMEARSGGFLGVERGRPAVDASIPTNGRPADWSRRTLPPNTSPNSGRVTDADRTQLQHVLAASWQSSHELSPLQSQNFINFQFMGFGNQSPAR